MRIIKNNKAVGIICEYNPIHNGHIYQINTVRGMGAETIVCLMSGNFTQRGDFALADKYKRAESAIESGADLVLELPFPFCCSSADYFARSGVYILDALSVGNICFGSERADLDQLYKLAEIANSKKFEQEYKSKNKGAVGMASSYFETLEQFSEQTGQKLLSNDILGLSYIKAIVKGNCDIEPIIIKRLGSAYDSELLPDQNGAFASATALRKVILKEGTNALSNLVSDGYISQTVADIYKNTEGGFSDVRNIERAILLYFRMNREKLPWSGTAKLFGGLVERICKAAVSAKTFEELTAMSATKKYTDATIKRAIIYSLCGVCATDLQNPPGYVNLLATNNKGRKYLSDIRGKSGVPVITKKADSAKIKGAYANRQRELSVLCDCLYTLSFKSATEGDLYIKKQPFVKKQQIIGFT